MLPCINPVKKPATMFRIVGIGGDRPGLAKSQRQSKQRSGRCVLITNTLSLEGGAEISDRRDRRLSMLADVSMVQEIVQVSNGARQEYNGGERTACNNVLERLFRFSGQKAFMSWNH